MAAIQSPQTMAILLQTTVIIAYFPVTSNTFRGHLNQPEYERTCASTGNTEHLLTLPQLYACSIVSFTLQIFERCSATIDIVTALTTIHH